MRLGKREIYYYDAAAEFEAERLAGRFLFLLLEEMRTKRKPDVVFLCIGTDRSTGDSLGPLIGHKLREQGVANTRICGTLEEPVHAMNLAERAAGLRNRFPQAVVVAVDASVGDAGHVGYVTVGRGSIRPGLGVRKHLDAVGDIFITGIVGAAKSGDPLMLQSVRLSLVMRLADCISRSIRLGLALLGPAPEPARFGAVFAAETKTKEGLRECSRSGSQSGCRAVLVENFSGVPARI